LYTQSRAPPAQSPKSRKMSTSPTFHGWIAHDSSAVDGKMSWEEFTPKPWTEDDVDIKITHCGVCGTGASIKPQAFNLHSPIPLLQPPSPSFFLPKLTRL